MKTSLLKLVSVGKHFGGLYAIQDINLELYPRQILSVIGPNGAGKTTLFNAVTGIFPADEGEIFMEGEKITKLPPHEICQRGLARTFQNIRLFKELSVLENVMLGQFSQHKINWPGILFRTEGFLKIKKEVIQFSEHLLEQMGIIDYEYEVARNLSYGLQRKVEIARALATRPKVLLLDEPGAGMNPTELNELIKITVELKESGLAIFFIEHHMKVVMEISDQIVVLDHGEEIAAGSPEEISSHPEVIAAYLGEPLEKGGHV